MAVDSIDPQSKTIVSTIATNAKASKNTIITILPDIILEKVSILFPAGHAGLTGVRLVYGGVALLPWNQLTQFIIGDSERLSFDIGMYVSGPITVATTNADTAAHSHFLEFTYHEYREQNAVVSLTPVPLAAL